MPKSIEIRTPDADALRVTEEPYYHAIKDEKSIFEAAYRAKVPVLLKGPTGCGKTRFVSHMAHQLNRPLITVACHEDLTASDLIGRYLLQNDTLVWSDGPMAAAVRMGAILYLDELVEARKDTTVAIHPLTDHRRSLSIDKLATTLQAPKEFMLVVSYNPGYQSIRKEMKPSTRQRFVSLRFDYPEAKIEAAIIEQESGVSESTAQRLSQLAINIRALSERGLEEGVSTRLLVHAARLIHEGIPPLNACQSAFSHTLTDDLMLQDAIHQLCQDYF